MCFNGRPSLRVVRAARQTAVRPRLSAGPLRLRVIDPVAILAQYDREMRKDPPDSSGAHFAREGPIVREEGDADTIVYADLTHETAPVVVREQARRARSLNRTLEWKVYSHDRPPELPSLLEQEGFRADEPETLVALELEGPPGSLAAAPDVVVREVTERSGFDDGVAVSAAAFGPSGPETLEKFRERLMDPTARLFVAYRGGSPVGFGRLELPPGRAFASLWGGGTDPVARHRGVYRTLVRARADRARNLGYRFLTVDARETSRPILERLGFVPLSRIRGWRLSRSREPAATDSATAGA
jgi:ribosomal protein S18 acetylase RimI-like enzyme